MKIFNTKNCALLLVVFLTVNSALALDQGTLQVTSITPTQTLATPDGNFDNGWQWIFNITVPNNETVLRLKFADWTSGTNTIPTGTNVRFYSPQSSNSYSTSTAKVLSSANVYSDTITLSPQYDLSSQITGRQIQVVVDVRVPTGTTGGSYASSYGVSSDLDPNQLTGTISYTVDPSYQIISVNGNQTNQIIGQVIVNVKNEDIKLNTLRLDPKFLSSTTPTFSGLSNLKLFVNGTQFGPTKTWNLSDAPNPLTFNATSDAYLLVGTSTITVKSDINFLDSLTVSTGTLLSVIGGLDNNSQGITTNRLISVFSVPFSLATTTLTNYPALGDIVFQTNSGFTATTKSPNVSGVKIGSYTIQSGSEGISVNQITVGLSGTLLSSNQITNLTIRDGSTIVGTPIGNPSSSNNFSTNLSINSTNQKTLDIYADLGSGSNGLNVTPTMSLVIRGNVTNQTKTTDSISGQTTSVATPTINSNNITVVNSQTPISKIVIAQSTNNNIVTYNIKTANGIGGAVIKDMKFIADYGINSVTINGKTASVVGTTTTIFNVGINVPPDNSGVNLPVTVSIVCVGQANGCQQNSSNAFQLHLIEVTYNDGNSVQTLSTMVDSDAFIIYSTKPTVSATATQNSGLVLNAENKIGEVTVSADVAGSLAVRTLGFGITSSGINNLSVAGLRIADGNTTIPNTSCSNVLNTVCTFSNGYTIQAGTSKTFSLYGQVQGSVQASVVVSVSTTPNKDNFSWDDINGGSTNLSAFYIYNFPTASYSLRQ